MGTGLACLDAGERSAFRARTHRPPATLREPVCIGETVVGSVDPSLPDRLVAVAPWPSRVCRSPSAGGVCWQLVGDPAESLRQLGLAARAAGLVPRWHDEPLAVRDPAGQCLALVERGLTRLLGMPMQSVHLVGLTQGRQVWVQQRALHKAEGPGLWDTLMGGTVAHAESAESALVRELWEEAGLKVHQLEGLRHHGRIRVARPSGDHEGLGYAIDDIDCYTAHLADGLAPVNRDGEVIRFERLSPDDLLAWWREGRFTLEASAVLLHTHA